MLLRDIWDWFNMGHFNPINQMITLIMIPFSGVHCNNNIWDLSSFHCIFNIKLLV